MLEWQGRNLTMFSNSNGEIYNYAYNADGIRTQKNIFNANGDFAGSTEYIYDGTKLIAESRNGDWLYYFYDANGTVTGMYYNNVLYYFRKNLQGDVTGIYNASGNIIAQYEYTPYGAPLTITNGSGTDVSTNATHIANINPFRYRGYYYDTETGFYYLQSRYYDLVVGRMLTADEATTITLSPNELTDKNLFSYCDNNPISRADEDGDFWHVLIGGVVGAVSSFVSTITETGNIGKAFVSAGIGAVAGIATAIVPSASVAIDAAAGLVESVVDDALFSKEKKSFGEIATNALVSAGTSALFSYVGGPADDLNGSWRAAKQAKRKIKAGNIPNHLKKSAIKDIKRYRKKCIQTLKDGLIESIFYQPLIGAINKKVGDTTEYLFDAFE